MSELPENASYEELIEQEEQILRDENEDPERLATAALRVADYAAQRPDVERSVPNDEAVLDKLEELAESAPSALFESIESDRTEAFFQVYTASGYCYVHKRTIGDHETYAIMSLETAFRLAQVIDESDKTERGRLSGLFEYI